MKVNKFFLIALLVTVLGCGYVYFFTGSPRVSSPLPVMGGLDASAVHARAKMAGGPGQRVSGPRLEAAWVRDPFDLPRALVRSGMETDGPPPRLVAILSGKDGRVAIIGSEVVKEGDAIFGERVRRIDRNGVVLGQGDSKRYLTLGGQKRHEAPKNANIEVGK